MNARPESWYRPAEPALGVVAVLAAAGAFLVAWGVLHHGFYTRKQIRDTPVYERYGDAIAAGQVPYRDFRPEYPPVALPVFALPSLVQHDRGDADAYRRNFDALMALCGVGALVGMGIALAALGADRRRMLAALGFTALAPLALGSVVLSRFDLWPAALTSLALAAFLAGRPRVGSGVLGVAVAAKIYPAVLAPLLAVWLWRRAGRRDTIAAGAVFAAALALAFVPFLVVAPGGLTASFHEQLSRPLQLESLGAAALVAGKHVGGLALHMESSHGSQNIGGSIGVVVGWLETALQLAVLVGVWLAFARGPATRERLVRYAAAAVVAFVALGKVLSPQFLIWLVPLVPLVRGRRGVAASAVLGAAVVLTQVWFPFRYWDYALRFDATVSWLVLGRDVLLLALLAVLLWPESQPAERREAGEAPADERRPAALTRAA